MKYPVAPNGVFFSIQGEAHLRGFQMAFVRLAGCSVGCPECDTDYSVSERLTSEEIVDRVEACFPPGFRDRWVWVTGGEPYDHNLRPLYAELRARGCSIAVATSGVHRAIAPVDWLSVSYHGGKPFLQKYGDELKIVVGMNGMDPFAFMDAYPDDEIDFPYRYVQPVMVDGAIDATALETCKRFLEKNPNWGLSMQDHKAWGMP